MKLADAEAQNTYRNNAFFVTQSYALPLQRVTDSDFSLADLSAVFIGHSFEYSSWSKVYTDIKAGYTNERGERDPETGEFKPYGGVTTRTGSSIPAIRATRFTSALSRTASSFRRSLGTATAW